VPVKIEKIKQQPIYCLKAGSGSSLAV